MKEYAAYALDVAASLKVQADVRVIKTLSQYIETKNRKVACVSEDENLGLGVRVLYRGGWGFASAAPLNKIGIRKAVEQAVAIATASSKMLSRKVELVPEDTYRSKWISPYKKDPFIVPVEDKIALLLQAEKLMRKAGGKGCDLTSGLLEFVKEEKLFLSTNGSEIWQTFITSAGGIDASVWAAKTNEYQTRSYPQSWGGQWAQGGWEAIEGFDLTGNAERIADEAKRLSRADICPATVTNLILGGSQLALQIHESCGHPCELDRALGYEENFAGSSFLTPDKLGALTYASPLVNLVADATVGCVDSKLGSFAPVGSFAFDDEGVPGQRIFLVKDGIFSGYLSSRETAGIIGLERSSGAMRAESAESIPIVRMTNISLLPGSAGTLADLIADTKSGILMDTNNSWSIDDKRYNFQFGTEVAWEIKRGKLTGRVFRNPSYWGITTQFWNKCDAICGPTEFIYWGVPSCAKGQPVQTIATGHGAAPARFRNVKIAAITDSSQSSSTASSTRCSQCCGGQQKRFYSRH